MTVSTYLRGDNYKTWVPQVRAMLPEFFKSASNETLIAFLEAYFEWREQAGNVQDRIFSIHLLADVDFGVDEFFENFRKELMPLIPQRMLADKKQILKNIVQFYERKGTPKALQFFFRMVFDSEIIVEYPSPRYLVNDEVFDDDVEVIRIDYTTPNIPTSHFAGKRIRGLSSGAEADVDSIYEGSAGTIQYVELTIINKSTADFVVGETIRTTAATEIQQGTVYSLVNSFNIVSGGTNYLDDELIALLTPGDGEGFESKILETSGEVDTIVIEDGGVSYASTPSVTITGDGTSATATAVIDGGRVVEVNVTSSSADFTTATVTFSGGDPIRAASASALIRGVITDVQITDPGAGYNTAPTINPTFAGGSGANITFGTGSSAVIQNRFPRYHNDEHLVGLDLQKFNVLLIFQFGGTGDFIVGETVTQEDDLGRVLFEAQVIDWDPLTRSLITTRADIDTFNSAYPVIGQTSTAEWMFGSVNSRPIRIDTNVASPTADGAGEIEREHTYYIRSEVPIGVYRDFVKKNAHVAGKMMIGVFDLVSSPFDIASDASVRLFYYFAPDYADYIDPTTGRPHFREYILEIDHRDLDQLDSFAEWLADDGVGDLLDSSLESLEDEKRITSVVVREEYAEAVPTIPELFAAWDFSNPTLRPTIGEFEARIVCTRASETTYKNRMGNLVTVPANTPAYYFDSEGNSLGMVQEPAGTNLTTFPATLGNGAWTKNAVTIETGHDDPETGTDGELVLETAATGEHGVSRVYTLTAGTRYCYSRYLSYYDADRTKYRLYIGDLGSEQITSIVDLWNGTIDTPASGAGITVNREVLEEGGGGYYRYAVVFTTGASTSITIKENILLNDGTLSYAGDATKGQLWTNAQLETDHLTSYMPNGTRAGTSFKVLHTNLDGVDDNEGTIYLEVYAPYNQPNDVYFATVSDGTLNNNAALVRKSATGYGHGVLVDGGSTEADMTDSTMWLDGQLAGLALGYQFQDMAYSFNRNTEVTDITTSVLGPYTQFTIGCNADESGGQPNCVISRIFLYNKRVELSPVVFSADTYPDSLMFFDTVNTMYVPVIFGGTV